ncbi:glycosyltransferase [Rosistilla ulvae]|uniref:glycosyltransferase n=1 Tax=Rosistilla ulvae TaxID=1930277 RepID=UPI003704BB33
MEFGLLRPSVRPCRSRRTVSKSSGARIPLRNRAATVFASERTTFIVDRGGGRRARTIRFGGSLSIGDHPTFNPERCLLRLIASVQNQTFQDWEMLVVENGSTDGSLGLRYELAEKD